MLRWLLWYLVLGLTGHVHVNGQDHLRAFKTGLEKVGADPTVKPVNLSKVTVQFYIYGISSFPSTPEAFAIDLWVWITYKVPQWGGWEPKIPTANTTANATAGHNHSDKNHEEDHKIQMATPPHEHLFFWVPPHQFDTTTVTIADDTIGSSSHYVNIYNSGKIEVKKKITTKTTCAMDFRAYPFDKQQCFLRLVFDEGIELAPVGDSESLMFDGDVKPQSVNTLKIKEYNLSIGWLETTGDEECTACAKLSTANLRLLLEREPMTYFLKHCLPLLLVAVLSLLSLWIDGSPPARAILSVTALVSLLTFIPRAEQGLPEGIHLTITGIYINICLSFVVANMLVFVILAWLAKLPERKKATLMFKKNKHEWKAWQAANGIPVKPPKEGGLKRFKKRRKTTQYKADDSPYGKIRDTEEPPDASISLADEPRPGPGPAGGTGRKWGIGALRRNKTRSKQFGVNAAEFGEWSTEVDSEDDEYLHERQKERKNKRRDSNGDVTSKADVNTNEVQPFYSNYGYTPEGHVDDTEGTNFSGSEEADDEVESEPPLEDYPPHDYDPKDDYAPRIKVFWVFPVRIPQTFAKRLDKVAKGFLPIAWAICTVVFFVATPSVRNPSLEPPPLGKRG